MSSSSWSRACGARPHRVKLRRALAPRSSNTGLVLRRSRVACGARGLTSALTSTARRNSTICASLFRTASCAGRPSMSHTEGYCARARQPDAGASFMTGRGGCTCARRSAAATAYSAPIRFSCRSRTSPRSLCSRCRPSAEQRCAGTTQQTRAAPASLSVCGTELLLLLAQHLSRARRSSRNARRTNPCAGPAMQMPLHQSGPGDRAGFARSRVALPFARMRRRRERRLHLLAQPADLLCLPRALLLNARLPRKVSRPAARAH